MRAGSAPHFPLEERVARFRSFYQRANERPLLGFFVGSEYPLRRYRASDSLPSDRPLAPEDFAVGPYLDDCERLFNLHEACGGDFIWSAGAFWGIPWLEAALEIYRAACRAHKKSAGMHIIRPNEENVRRALDEGYTMLALGLDNVFMEQSARASLKAAGR